MDITVKHLDEFESAYGGLLRRVRSGLGVSSFGIAVVELPPRFEGHPEHDHEHDGQEEVYAVLEGAATLRAGGTEHLLEPGMFARIGPGERRQLVTGDERARVLLLGGSPDAIYVPPVWTEEGSGEVPSDAERRALRRAQLGLSPRSGASASDSAS